MKTTSEDPAPNLRPVNELEAPESPFIQEDRRTSPRCTFPDAQDFLAKLVVALGISRRNLLEIVREQRFTTVPTQVTGPDRPVSSRCELRVLQQCTVVDLTGNC